MAELLVAFIVLLVLVFLAGACVGTLVEHERASKPGHYE